MKRTIVEVDAGADFTSVRATIAAHSIRAYENGDRSNALEYKIKNDGSEDGFDLTFITDEQRDNNAIEQIGPGAQGIIGRPPNYCGTGHPTLGDPVLYVRRADGAAFDLVFEEDVNQKV